MSLERMFSEEFRGRLEDIASEPRYASAFEMCLMVQIKWLGPVESREDEDRLELPLAECNVHTVPGRHEIEIKVNDRYLHFEADHRGAEHGVDAWIGRVPDPEPLGVIEDIGIEGELA